MCDELKNLVETNELLAAESADTKPQLADVETIKGKTYALKDYAYENDIINWTTKNTIEMNKQGGIIGSIINATTEESEEDGLSFHTNNHVHPEWVANDGSLMAAFGNASSQALVEDAYAQPSSRILSIGDGKYLLVFLGDTASRVRGEKHAHAHPMRQPHGKRHLLGRIAFVAVQPPLHHQHVLAAELAIHEAPDMLAHGGFAQEGHVGVWHHHRVLHLVGHMVPSAPKHEEQIRYFLANARAQVFPRGVQLSFQFRFLRHGALLCLFRCGAGFCRR
jgi:hypothetical protein